MKAKILKITIPVAAVLIIAAVVLTVVLNKGNQNDPLILSLNYNDELVNGANTEYHPITYGDLAFTQNGMVEDAMEFRNGHIEFTGSENISVKDSFTFSTWIKVTDTASIDPIIFCRESTAGDKVSGPLNIHFSDQYTFLRTDITVIGANGDYVSHSFPSEVLWSQETVTSMWHYLTVVFDKDRLSYYVDGVLSSTEMIPESFVGYKTIANNSKIFSIGAGEFDDMYAILDETLFYSSALTQEEITALYEGAKKVYNNTLILKPESIDAIYNGKAEKLPVKVTRDQETERLMVPLQYITDKMGGQIIWDKSDGYGRADITLGETQISIWVMDTNALANHKYCKLDAYPQEIDGVMCVPIRFVAEELGASVNWNEEKEEVTILF